jgi:plastocyanin
VLAVAVTWLLLAGSAHAEQQTFRYGPIPIGPYSVNERDTAYDIPKPSVDGFVTGMEAHLVDANGARVPVQRVMLHHLVFSNVGTRVGERRNPTCGRITLFDGVSQVPGLSEPFFGTAEEDTNGRLPDGYGYPVKGDDQWVMTWMLMNHQNRPDAVYIQYTVNYVTGQSLAPAYPVALDVRDCRLDPVFDVPGGGGPGSTYSQSTTWTAPYAGRIIAAVGHLHGGGKSAVLSEPDCGDRTLLRSVPTWGLPNDPFYRVRPILHEPGPINMSLVLSKAGFPVAAGERLKLTVNYDDELPHMRVMGIMGIAIAPDPKVTDKCAPLPNDVQVQGADRPGRSVAPKWRVPINAVNPDDGLAEPIASLPGPTVGLGTGDTVDVADSSFQPDNIAVRPGSVLRWSVLGPTLHTVTLANGPQGFSSPNLSDGRTFEHRFTKPGTYQIFCSLHPTLMSETVRVLPPQRRRRRR